MKDKIDITDLWLQYVRHYPQKKLENRPLYWRLYYEPGVT